jgi:hypothetical protein
MKDYRNKVLVSSLQSRLGMKQDRLRRLILDDQQALVGFLVDAIRVKARKTYEGDTTSYIVEAADIIKCSFPPLESVPFRKIKKDVSLRWQLTSLVGSFEEDQTKAYTLGIPFDFDIDVGDLIFRIFLDEAQQYPIVLALQISEMLGTFGAHQIILQECKSVIPTENFPDEIIETIQKMAERRLRIKY